MDNKLGKFLIEKQGDLSLREFAKKLDISHTYLDNIEKGYDGRTKKPVRITVDTLSKIANALNEPIEKLVLYSINSNCIEEKIDSDNLEIQCNIKNKYTNRIKQLRDEQNISQIELGKKLNKTQQQISLYENNINELDLDGYVILSKLFDCCIEYIAGKSNLRNPERADISKKYGSDSIQLLDYYKCLNKLGKLKALENIKDLTEVPKYTNKSNDNTDKKNNIQEA